ncbi:MAG: hypothetical protein LAO21_03050 [Acidobacteriia bacterium]|nr:hypothetical protein [Terriglobia bacterium]
MECSDLEYVLRQQDPERMEALVEHARLCVSCREELNRWNEISAAAASLRKSWDSPHLWLKIQDSLVAESQNAPSGSKWHFQAILQSLAENWQAAAAVAALVLISSFSVGLLWRHPQTPAPTLLQRSGNVAPQPSSEETPPSEGSSTPQKRLLTEQALIEIESTEAAYVRSLDRLAQQVQPELQSPTSPLMMNYREKLLLIDSAIAECRGQIEMNPYNGHLRRELLAMYQEKHRTLQDLLTGGTHEQQ